MAHIWPLRGRKWPLNTSRPRLKSRQEDSPTNNPARTYLSFLTGPQHHSQQTPFCCFFLELLQLVLGGHDALMVTRAQAPGLARGGPKGICAKERRSNGVEVLEFWMPFSAVSPLLCALMCEIWTLGIWRFLKHTKGFVMELTMGRTRTNTMGGG
jgi:hypothetical protein